MTDTPTDLIHDLLALADDTIDELWLAVSTTKPDLCATMSERLGQIALRAETFGIKLRTIGDTSHD